MEQPITTATPEQAYEQKWEEPYTEEPFESPDEWEYRGMLDMGGGMVARVWRHKQKVLEVMYGMRTSPITVVRAKYSEEEDKYIGDIDNVVELVDIGDDYTELDKRTVAEELLEKYA